MPDPAKITITVDGVQYAVDGIGNVAKAGRDLKDAAGETGEAVKGWGGIMSSVFGSFPAHIAEGELIRDSIHEIIDVTKEAVLELPHLVEHAVEIGNSVYEMSLKTGASVEGLSSLRYVASQTGIEFGSFGNALNKMEVALGSSGAKADAMQGHLDKIHLSLKTLKDEKPDQAFIDIMTGLEGIPNRADQAAVGMALFGKGFKDMAGLTQESIVDLMAEAKDLGLVMSTETAAGAHAAEIGYKALSMQMESVQMQIGSAFIPAVIGIEKVLSQNLKSAVQEANKGLDAMGGGGGFLSTVATAMGHGNEAILAQTKLYEYLRDGLIGVARYGIEPVISAIAFMDEEWHAAKVVAGDVMQIFDGVRLSFLGMRQAMSLGLLPGSVDLTQWKALDQQMADLELKMFERGRSIAVDKAAEADWAAGSKTAIAAIEAEIGKLGGAHIDVGKIIEELAKVSHDAYGGIGSDTEQGAKKADAYAKAWQTNEDAIAKIWAEAFVAEQNVNSKSLDSQVAVLEAKRQNEENAEIVRIATSTASEEQRNMAIWAIRRKYAALENDARLNDERKRQDDEEKAQGLALDLETHLNEEVRKLAKKLEDEKLKILDETNKAVVKNLDDSLKYEREANDATASLYLSTNDYKLRLLDEWMADERAKLQARQVYSEQAEENLRALYAAKATAIAAANDPIFQAWRNLNGDMRQEMAATWSANLSSTQGFIDALESPFKALGDRWKKVLGAMMADYEAQLLQMAGINIPGLSSSGGGGGTGGGYGGLIQSGGGLLGRYFSGAGGSSTGGNGQPYQMVGPDEEGTISSPYAGYGVYAPGQQPGGSGGGSGGLNSAYGAGAALVANATEGWAQTSKTGQVVNAAAKGAEYGSIVPGWGTLIGAGVGAVVGMLEVSPEEKIARTTFEDFQKMFVDSKGKALDLNDTIKSIGLSYASLGINGVTAQAAIQRALDATHESSEAEQAALKPIIDTLAEASQRASDVAAGLKTIGPAFNSVVAGTSAAVAGYDALKQAVTAAGDAQKAALAKGDTRGAATAADDLAAAVQRQSVAAKGAKQELGDLGVQAVATFASEVAAGMSVSDAMASISPSLKTLQQSYTDLGLDVDDVALKNLLMQNNINTANPQLMSAIGGLGGEMEAMDKIGSMNVDTFGSMERTGMQMYTRLQAQVASVGGTTKDALVPMQGYLHDAMVEAQNLGVPLDDNTQMLIAQSKNLGIWKDTGKSAADILDLSMKALVDRVSTLIDRLSGPGGVTDAIGNIPRNVTVNVQGVYTPPNVPNGSGTTGSDGSPTSFANEGYDLSRPMLARVGDNPLQTESVLHASTVRDIVRASRNAGTTDSAAAMGAAMAPVYAELKSLRQTLATMMQQQPMMLKHALRGKA